MNIRFNKALKVALFLLATFALLLGALNVSPGIAQAQGQQDDPGPAGLKTKLCDGSALQAATFTLDGVTLNLCTAFLPGPFISAEADNSMQVATAVNPDKFEELSITTVPFGTKPPSEDLPVAKSGMEGQYRKLLQKARVAQGGSPQAGPTITIFGKQVVGSTSLVNLDIDTLGPKPVLITEWVVEAGKRLWIVRASQESSAGATASQQASTANTLSGQFSMSSSNLDQPSTLIQSLENESAPVEDAPSGAGDAVVPGGATYPAPSWWHGVCDTDFYYAHSGHKKAYPLGGSYQGIIACGPRTSPRYKEGPAVVVRFFPNAWGEYEWECVELSMRYLYIAYGIKPYGANGKDVVPNYKGTKLVKFNNGRVGHAPQPGDVLSYGITAGNGHTSVVSASNVNASGNGSITIIEQNGSAKGTRTHQVVNWRVQDVQTVIGWLHNPVQAPPTPPIPLTPTPTPIRPTVTPITPTVIPPFAVWVHVPTAESTYPGGWVYISTQNTIYWSIDNPLYTRTRTVGYPTDSDWTRWRPTLSISGYYRVCAADPSYTHNTGVTTKARYTIHSATGDTLQIVNQAAQMGTWMNLGRYQFNAGTDGNVYLGDYTGDNPTQLLAIDAVKFVWSPTGSEICQ